MPNISKQVSDAKAYFFDATVAWEARTLVTLGCLAESSRTAGADGAIRLAAGFQPHPIASAALDFAFWAAGV